MTQKFDISKFPIVWFDLDDTLWDMTGNSCIALEKLYDTDPTVRLAFAARGLRDWMDVYHRINRVLWRQYDAGTIDRATLRRERFALPLQEAGLGRDEACGAAVRLDRDYLRYLGDCPALVPGARQAVDALLAAGVRMGIVSNGFREVQYRKLASGGLDGIFSPIVLSDDTGINKPARGFFDFAVRAAGMEPEECLLVGDNARSDIGGALDAGWGAALWLDNGSDAVESELAGRLLADPRCVRFTDMAQVPALLGLG